MSHHKKQNKKTSRNCYLKVVGNEKEGGSGVWLLLKYSTGPW
jgi:hypothetical protein